MTSSELAVLLEGQRFRVGTEAALQDGIAAFLTRSGIHYQREYRFEKNCRVQGDRLVRSKDIVDFLVDGIACEVKIHGGPSEVTRQLHRYAQHEVVTSLVLVTSRMQLCRVPRELNGKTVSVAALLGGL
jgi:hypothetical protein